MKRPAIAAAAALVLAAAPAFADLDARARLGFGGRWVMDAATPVAVTLTNTGERPLVVDVSVSQSDTMTGPDVVHRRTVRLPPATSREELFLVPGPRQWNGGLRVGLEVDPSVPIHSPRGSGDRGSLTFDVEGSSSFTSDEIAYASGVVGVVGDPNGRVAARVREAGLSAAGDTNSDRRPFQRIEVLGIVEESLRLAPIGLDGMNAVLVCDPDAAFCNEPETLDGLLDWVSLGGALVVSLGEHAGAFAASPLAREMPATWTGSDRVSMPKLLGKLGALTDAAIDGEGPCAVLTPKEESKGRSSTNGPLRAERRFGRGRIVLLGYCLRDVISVAGIDGSGVRTLLAPVIVAPATSKTAETLDEFVRPDFTGTIGRVLQQGAFEPPPLPLVVLGIILYVVVVGPLDWFVLKRLRKERLTTLTFLGAVAGFTILAYGASILLFSTGARINRVVIADLCDAGRDGRQILRFTDIAGYYSPTGADQNVSYGGAAVVLPPGLPGSSLGGVGSPLPVQVASADPLHPNAVVQLAFRSQRVVRAVSVGTIGPTIDVEWRDERHGGGVRVVNGLPVDLDDVAVYVDENSAYSLGPVRSGGTSKEGTYVTTIGPRDSIDDDAYQHGYGGGAGGHRLDRLELRRTLETMTVGSWTRKRRRSDSDLEELAGLRKAGICLSAAFEARRAVVVAHASKFPVPLPGDRGDGDVYVVLRKEVSLP